MNMNQAALQCPAEALADEYKGDYTCSYVDGVFVMVEDNDIVLDMSGE